MKKILGTIFLTLLVMLAVGVVIGFANKRKTAKTEVNGYNKTVESLVKEDFKYFDNMAGKVVLYEVRVVMPQAFNIADKFVAQEVCNVFQNTIETKTGFETTVYFFTHQLNDCNTDVDIHRGAFVLDDKPIEMDSIEVTFDKAFKLAKQSNYIPSKSRYMTLRHGVGAVDMGLSYWIGNDNYGLMFVDAVTGKVTDKK